MIPNILNLSIDGLDYLIPNFDIRDRNVELKKDFLKYTEWYNANHSSLEAQAN